jgi:hypothetical protein
LGLCIASRRHDPTPLPAAVLAQKSGLTPSGLKKIRESKLKKFIMEKEQAP